MIHLIREFWRLTVQILMADDRAGFKGQLAMVKDARVEIRKVHEDMALPQTARHVDPALALHCHDHGFQPILRALIDLVNRGTTRHAIHFQPVVFLELANRVNDRRVVTGRHSSIKISHRDQSITQGHDPSPPITGFVFA